MKTAAQTDPLTIPAAKFKAHCLSLMDEVRATQRSITVTKRGKPVGQFVPMAVEKKPFRSIIGRSRNARILGDVISPLPQEWTLPEFAWENKPEKTKKGKKKK